MLPFLARVDLGAMPVKGCSAFPNAPALLEPHHQILIGRVLPLCRGAVGVFYSPSRLGKETQGTARKNIDWLRHREIHVGNIFAWAHLKLDNSKAEWSEGRDPGVAKTVRLDRTHHKFQTTCGPVKLSSSIQRSANDQSEDLHNDRMT